METECKDRLTFQNFLDYPEKVPDARTIWLFRERIAKQKGKEKELWNELQGQLNKYKVRVKEGSIKDAMFTELGGWRAEGRHGPVVEIAPHTGYAQDSTIIDADPGVPTEEDVKRREEAEAKKKKQKKSDDSSNTATAVPPPVTTALISKIETKPRGEEANTRRSRDGTWTKKNKQSYFGYKLHTKNDLHTGFISALEVTTASVHDGNVDLTNKGEPCVRDKGYMFSGGKGICVSMIRAWRGEPLTEKDKELNKFLSKVRAPVEHPYAVIKRVFHGGSVLVTTIVRVKIKMTFECMRYNLFRAHTLSRLV